MNALMMFSPPSASSRSLRYAEIPPSNPAPGRRDPTLLAEAIALAERSYLEQKLDEWIAETEHVSSVSVMTRHPAFHELMKRGDSTARLILEKLQSGIVFYHYFPLLKRCTGQDPVPPHDRGLTKQMIEHWVGWGKDGGKI